MTTSERRNITQPDDWLAAIEAAAAAESVSVSEWIGDDDAGADRLRKTIS